MANWISWENKIAPPLRQLEITPERESTCRIIVEVTGRAAGKVPSLIESHQGKVLREIAMIPSFVAEMPVASVRELARSNHVIKIWHDAPVYAMQDSVDINSGRSAAPKSGYTGRGVIIAVLDTGIHPHNDLINPENRILAWNDLINHEKYPYDDHGHGTVVAGIIAGNGAASEGKYQGVAPEARLVGVKVLDENGIGVTSDIISGIEWCINNLTALNIKILNLSLGTTPQASYRLDLLCRATTKAWNKGILVCAASGNGRIDIKTTASPGINARIITAGNFDISQTITSGDERLNQSIYERSTFDRSVKPDVVAPGNQITSIKKDDEYINLSGVSMATSLVTGGAALIIQKYPKFTPDRVKYLLKKKSKDLGLGVNLQGAGLLDLENILTGAKRKKHDFDLIQTPNAQLLNILLHLINANRPNLPQSGNDLIVKVLMPLLSNVFK